MKRRSTLQKKKPWRNVVNRYEDFHVVQIECERCIVKIDGGMKYVGKKPRIVFSSKTKPVLQIEPLHAKQKSSTFNKETPLLEIDGLLIY